MEVRAWAERLMGLGPEWWIEQVDEDAERQETRVCMVARKALRCPKRLG